MTAPTAPPLPLRDIHLPPAVSWWPPAPGWWALAALVLLAAGAWVLLRRLRRRPPALKKRALNQLRVLAQGQDETDPLLLTRKLSILLRRTSLSYYPRTEVAGLVGDAWLRFLDDVLGEPRFSEGPGRALLDAPYRPAEAVDVAALQNLCADWILALPGRVRPEAAPRRRFFRRPKLADRTVTEPPLSNGRKE